MRKREDRFEWADIDDPICDTLISCRIKVKTSLAIAEWERLTEESVSSIGDFLAKAIVEWEGFDMPLTRANLSTLTMAEMRAISRAAMAAIQNPQKPTSDGSH